MLPVFLKLTEYTKVGTVGRAAGEAGGAVGALAHARSKVLALSLSLSLSLALSLARSRSLSLSHPRSLSLARALDRGEAGGAVGVLAHPRGAVREWESESERVRERVRG